MRSGRGALVPAVPEILDAAAAVQVRGGWVFAQGRGALSGPASTLHRREGFGIARRGSSVSVDTGKYPVAPWLARDVVERLLGPA